MRISSRAVPGRRVAMLAILAGLFVFTNLFGCNGSGCNSGCTNAPAAVQPTLSGVFAVLTPGGAWVNVGANPSHQFEIIPGGLPSGGIKIMFNAPYPTSLHVQIDGADLPDFANVPSGTDPATTGFFRIENVDPNPNPALWRVGVRPPNSKLMQSTYTIAISDISINQNYPVGNPQHESSPLNIVAVRQKVFTLTVMKTGAGTIISTPAGISCGGTCTFDFGQSTTVTLSPNAASGATFSGWTGPDPCLPGSGGTGDCKLTLNGTAAAVTATFTASSSGSMQGCPGAKVISGFVYLGEPGCATNDIAGHPSATLGCDSNGYYCCELSQGENTSTRCHQDHHEFPPDCMAYGTQGQLKQPNGCYAIDMP